MTRAMLVLVAVVALLLGGVSMAEASGKGSRSVGRMKTKAVKPHTQRTAKGKRVQVKGYKRAESQR